ncbi:MAG: hypothetical protein HWE24_07385 [Oceanospirillaceae bacterium]|nr:hypothetical protein [Oceanospirillaceae bacterium]
MNFNLIDLFHGWTFECILIRFINHHEPNTKLKCKTLYDSYAEVEVVSNFQSNSELSLQEFKTAFDEVKLAVSLANQIENKSQKDYDLPKLLQDLESIKVPASIEELIELENNLDWDSIHQKRVDGLIAAWREYPLPHNRKLQGIRIYDQFDKGDLWPYAYIYSELLTNLLNKAQLTTPGYREIYFSVSHSLTEAKKNLALNTWHKYTYCSLNIEKFRSSDDRTKSKMLFESLKGGLRLIADFDKLDREKVEDVIRKIELNGTDSELIVLSKSKGDIKAQVVHSIPHDHRAKTTYYLELSSISTGESGKVKIAEIHSLWAPYIFGSLKIKKDVVEITGRKSERADVTRAMENLPERFEFRIEEVLKRATLG